LDLIARKKLYCNFCAKIPNKKKKPIKNKRNVQIKCPISQTK